MRLICLFLFTIALGAHLNGQSANNANDRQSLFDYLFDQEERPRIAITTDTKHLLRTRSKKEYQPAQMLIELADAEKISLSGEVKARGMTRKKVCHIPPVKFDFNKGELDSLGFSKIDKLKFVFPCKDSKYGQVKLYKEYFLYGLYNLIDSNALEARLVDVQLDFEGEEVFSFTGVLLEDEDNYSNRKKARVAEIGTIKAPVLHRSSFVNMMFFQYMISNTDWAISNRHNIEIVLLETMQKPIALPYDFDYSGFVDQWYALPHKSLPIESVHERHFFSYAISESEFANAIKTFTSLEESIMNYCDSATYMDSRTIKENKSYLKSFFQLLKNPKMLKREINIQ